MALLILLLALLPRPIAQAPDAPPFDPSRAYYDPNLGMWCDPNWCVYDPNGPNGWMYSTPGCPADPGLMCGWARLDAEDPTVRQIAVDQLADFWCAYGGTCAVPIAVRGVPPWSPRSGKDGGQAGPGSGGGGGGGGGDRNPPGGADSCPAPEVVRDPPRVEIESLPPNPIVVGQDPDRKGVIYRLVVRVPPVVYRRYEKEPDRCEPVPDADGDGKPDRSGSCWTQIGDPPVRWPGDLKAGGCRLVEERYPDPVAGDGRLEMILSPSSRAWIEGELAARYPGARVRMPEIRMPIRGQGEILADKTFVLKAEVNPKPVDPGIYIVEFLFRTSGTPVSQPIEIRKRIEQKVWLMESAIVR